MKIKPQADILRLEAKIQDELGIDIQKYNNRNNQ